MIGGNLAFGMGDGELTNQHPAWEILQEILWEILQEILWEILWEMLWEILREMLQEILWEILQEILQEMLQEILQEMLWEMLQEILQEMAWEMMQFFSLNTWLRMIYCLQTIHEPACVILTLFYYFKCLELSVEIDRDFNIPTLSEFN